MAEKIKKIMLWIVILFLSLFLGRLIYLTATFKDSSDPQVENPMFEDHLVLNSEVQTFGYVSRNYAKEKIVAQAPAQPAKAASAPVEQQYEQIATLTASTHEFGRDEGTVRQAVKEQSAVIQYEQNRGLEGHRFLQVVIGVTPARFDALVAELKKVGRILSTEVTKTDKTGEYRALLAKRQSLLETKKSLLSLKDKSGKIDEFINLENKITEVQKELQELGNSIGDFEGGADLCTVRLSLVERVINVSIWDFISKSLGWAFDKTAQILLVALLAFGVAALAIFVVEQGRKLPSLVEKK